MKNRKKIPSIALTIAIVLCFAAPVLGTMIQSESPAAADNPLASAYNINLDSILFVGATDTSYGATSSIKSAVFQSSAYNLQLDATGAPGGLKFVQVEAIDDRSYALSDDGVVWAWGFNGFGELGDGTSINRYTPAPIEHLSDVVSIAVDELGGIALKADGTVWEFGNTNWCGPQTPTLKPG